MHHLPQRVYYEDTDFSGFVYHANYLKFMERGRTEFLRSCGINQQQMASPTEGEPLAFVVRSMAIDFRKPARMDDELDVITQIHRLEGARLELRQTVERQGTCLVGAEVVIALVTLDGRPRRLSPELVRQLTV